MTLCSGVARRLKFGTEIFGKRVRFYRNRKPKERTIPIRSPDPRDSARTEKRTLKVGKTAKLQKRLHVCARVIVPATKMNPEQVLGTPRLRCVV